MRYFLLGGNQPKLFVCFFSTFLSPTFQTEPTVIELVVGSAPMEHQHKVKWECPTLKFVWRIYAPDIEEGHMNTSLFGLS